jgi:hypothetical protein
MASSMDAEHTLTCQLLQATSGLPTTRQPLDKFESTVTELTRRIIEYELLPLNAAK